MTSCCCSLVLKPGLLGQSMLPTVATHAARNSRCGGGGSVELPADRTLSGRLYLKQWKRWHNPADNVVLSEGSYPYRPSWKKLYSRTTLAQPSFFEAVYEV